jgi:voltage-gated sodium channel
MQLRKKVQAWIETSEFEHFILGIIIVNAVTLGMEAVPVIVNKWHFILTPIDYIAVSIFIVEILLKLYCYQWRFFTSNWNIFDFIVIGFCIIPVFGNISVIRALRVLRLLRLISIIPKFRLIIQGFFESLYGLISVASLLCIFLYVGAVIASKIFGPAFPEYFGTLPDSLFSMFQIMTLEGWPDIARKVMGVFPYAWIFFVPFIMLTTFTIFNLLIGIIVNSMEKVHGEDIDQDAVNEEVLSKLLQAELSKIAVDIAEIKKKLH